MSSSQPELQRTPSLALGIDGGGSSTTCVVVDALSRKELARASSKSTNWNSVGQEQALATLKEVVTETLQSAGSSGKLASVCMCLSGIDTVADVTQMVDKVAPWFSDEGQQIRINVSNDAAAALASGTGGRVCGCVLIAGTGTIAYAVSADGRAARSSGYGPAFLDGGSGHHLGQQALAAVARAADGRSNPTILTQAVLQHCNVSAAEELMRWAYSDTSWARTAALAPLVVQAAEQHDAAAVSILEDAVRELTGSVTAAVKRSGLPSSFDLVLSGGLLERRSIFTSKLTQALQTAFPKATILQPQVRGTLEVDAATGAALVAANDAYY